MRVSLLKNLACFFVHFNNYFSPDAFVLSWRFIPYGGSTVFKGLIDLVSLLVLITILNYLFLRSKFCHSTDVFCRWGISGSQYLSFSVLNMSWWTFDTWSVLYNILYFFTKWTVFC